MFQLISLPQLGTRWVADWLTPRPLGERGERVAARYLRRRGYAIVERHFFNSYGEIDLVAVKRRTVVFIEVKTRRRADAEPLAAVTLAKQRRLSGIALAYLKQHDLLECATRFDVIGVVWPKDRRRPSITHLENAFEPTGTKSLFF